MTLRRLSPTRSRRSISIVAAAIIVAAIVLLSGIGCGRSPAPVTRTETDKAVQIDVGDPEKYLADVFGRYRSTAFYVDAGRAVLEIQYRKSGRREQTGAPLQVRWDSDRLAVDAYAVRLRGVRDETDRRMAYRAWIREPETSHFDRQMLIVSVPTPSGERPNLDPLLGDEVLRSRLSAGLAGPPPQLEWLFADEPMAGLFDPSSRFEQLPDASIAGSVMRRIAVLSRGQQYVFWVEPTSSLIRRVRLPVPESLRQMGGFRRPDDTRADPSGSQRQSRAEAGPPEMELTLELDGATFDPQQARQRQPMESAVRFAPDFTPTPVSRFVPVPPPPPPAVIGRTVSESAIRSLQRGGPSTDGGRENRGRPIFVVVRLPEQRGAVTAVLPQLAMIAGLRSSAEAAPSQAARRPPTALALIVPSREQRRWLKALVGDTVVVVDDEQVETLVAQTRLSAEAIATIGPDGQVLMIQHSLSADAIAATRAAVRDASVGVDVPRKLNDDYQSLVEAYEQALEDARASRALMVRHSAVFQTADR